MSTREDPVERSQVSVWQEQVLSLAVAFREEQIQHPYQVSVTVGMWHPLNTWEKGE
tara:strand:+ start:226 stop:393 length:168 start_codon:yes stop_codon:yes gene_type:complete